MYSKKYNITLDYKQTNETCAITFSFIKSLSLWEIFIFSYFHSVFPLQQFIWIYMKMVLWNGKNRVWWQKHDPCSNHGLKRLFVNVRTKNRICYHVNFYRESIFHPRYLFKNWDSHFHDMLLDVHLCISFWMRTNISMRYCEFVRIHFSAFLSSRVLSSARHSKAPFSAHLKKEEDGSLENIFICCSAWQLWLLLPLNLLSWAPKAYANNINKSF